MYFIIFPLIIISIMPMDPIWESYGGIRLHHTSQSYYWQSMVGVGNTWTSSNINIYTTTRIACKVQTSLSKQPVQLLLLDTKDQQLPSPVLLTLHSLSYMSIACSSSKKFMCWYFLVYNIPPFSYFEIWSKISRNQISTMEHIKHVE